MKTRITTTLILIVTQILLWQTIKAQCHIDDWTALKALYESTDGDNWNNRNGWDEMIDGHDSPPENCNLSVLHGVWNSFDDSERVDELVLDVNNLKGKIPQEIKGLKHLTYLSLDINELEGSLPPEIGDLSDLFRLEIVLNKLDGNLPTELGKLTQLNYLDLSNNQLTGELPTELGSITKLRSINLSNNKLEGDILEESIRLFLLEKLNLSNNQLTGRLPAQIGYLSNLVSLNVSNNKLSGCFPNNLKLLCQRFKQDSFEGNNFDTNWDEFCANDVGTCFDPCDSNYWTILKSLYESTDGDNWKNRRGWDLYFDNQVEPPKNCDLYNLYGISFNDEGNLTNILLGNNELRGVIPSNLADLKFLEDLTLEGNDLSYKIPPKLFSITSLRYMDLSHNEFVGPLIFDVDSISNLEFIDLGSNKIDGNIDSNIDKLNKLKFLFLYHNELNGQIPSSISNLNELSYLDLYNNSLNGGFYVKENSLNNLGNLDLARNQLSGDLFFGDGSLSNLKILDLSYNEFEGELPKIATSLELRKIELNDNKLSGSIPEFSSSILEELNISNNYFSCNDINVNFDKHQQIENFTYLPQHYTPINYLNNYKNILDLVQVDTIKNDTTLIDTTIVLNGSFPQDLPALIYQWKRNEEIIPGANQANLIIENVQPKDAGKYSLYIKQENCLSDSLNLELISEPIYVIIKGYDLLGQPVEYNQLMVQFDTPEETKKYEDEILYNPEYFGEIVKSCNCNRELYLWEFPTTEAAATALLEIDKKVKKLKRNNQPKGGFNNKLNIGESNEASIAYNIISDAFNLSYPDSVSVFILDSGLDEENYNATPFLYEEAAIDSCYAGNPSSGFSYVDSTKLISTNYKDDLWHGTFGFRSIADSFNEENNIKLVPLKIFNEKGEGNLFSMTCALYHAIDNGADIVNISAGYQGQPSEIFERAIRFAKNEGILITAAAGNDTLSIDSIPHYPAYYASKYYVYENYDDSGNILLDSLQYDHVISITSINEDNNLSPFSNFGEKSVTLAAYGNNIHSYGLAGLDAVASGTSMSTYFATKALALEIATNRNRDYTQILEAFDENWLVPNPALTGKTQTGKQINFDIIPAEIKGCSDCTACNYFSFANIDDGSCYFNCPNDEVACTDSTFVDCPEEALSTNTITLAIGENKPLMDLVNNNKTGYWTGENVIHVSTLTGESISYFSAYAAGIYKLYYTVKNKYCERSYILIVRVENELHFNNKIVNEFNERVRLDGTISKLGFTLSPNPTKDIVYINVFSKREANNLITIFNVNGKILFKKEIGKQAFLDLQNFPKGLYMVEVQNTEYAIDKSIQKLLIE